MPLNVISMNLFLSPFGARHRCGCLRFFLPLFVLLPLFFSPAVAATPLEFEAVLQQAVTRSFALKIAQSDISLRQIELKQVYSSYLPTMALRYDLGYVWALTGQGGVVSVGDSVSANAASTWQNSLSASLGLLLFDFGARAQKVAQSRHRISAAELSQAEQLQQLRSLALDLFTRGALAQRRLRALSAMTLLRKDLFRTLDQLQSAGTIGRARLQETALQLAADLTALDDQRLALEQALQALTALTGEDYRLEMIEFISLPEPGVTVSIIASERLPQLRIYDEELASLQAERSSVRRQMLPSLALAGNYRLYGADPNSLGRTLGELENRDASLALVLRWEFYSGGRDRLELARLEEEIHKMTLQRLQRAAELRQEIGSLQQAVSAYRTGEDNLRQRAVALEETIRSTARLGSQGVLDQPARLQREIEAIQQQLEVEVMDLNRRAEALRLRFWQEGVGS